MRTKLAVRNLVTGIALQIITAVYGILIPRFFIALYGSAVNGLVSSLTQFISYLSLVEAGLGTAVMIELYRPLAEDRRDEINAMMCDAGRMYRKAGYAFLLLLSLLVLIYPSLVTGEMEDAAFVRTLILILSVNPLVDFFLLGKYRALLMAAHRVYLFNIVQALGNTVVTLLSLLLMYGRHSVLEVKLAAALVCVFRGLLVMGLARKHFPFLKLERKDFGHRFRKRGPVLLHQISGILCLNTDMALLTILTPVSPLMTVSVYSVYDLVAYAVQSAVNSFSDSALAGFGQMWAAGETEALRKSFHSYEFLYDIFIVWIYTCMAVLLYPFIRLYTEGLADREMYLSWTYAFLFVSAGLLRAIRNPANTLINAAGHYEETKWRSVTEAAINILLSLLLIPRLGIVGALIGTVCAYLYRAVDVIGYSNRHFLDHALIVTARRLLRNLAAGALVCWAGIRTVVPLCSGWISWIAMAAGTALAAGLALLAVNWMAEREETRALIRKLRRSLGKGGRNTAA